MAYRDMNIRLLPPSLAGILLAANLGLSTTASAETRLPPVVDQLATPFTESEATGLGCLVASVAAGGAMTYLMGGMGVAMAALSGPLPPVRVVEGSAALAFVFSSACYVGVALSPLVVATYTSVTDWIALNQVSSPVTGPLLGAGESLDRAGAPEATTQADESQPPLSSSSAGRRL